MLDYKSDSKYMIKYYVATCNTFFIVYSLSNLFPENLQFLT